MGNPRPPSAEELRAALEDLDSDAVFWFQSARVLETAGTAAKGLDLSGFEFGIFAVESGLLDKYTDVRRFVVERLGEGVLEIEKLAVALRNAIDRIDGADRDGAAGIGTAAAEAIGSALKNRPGR